MNDLEAAIGLEGLEQFHQTIENRVMNRAFLMELLEDLSDVFWFPNLGSQGEFVSPHAFPLVLREDNPDRCRALYQHLEQNGIQCKTLFGSMPTQHDAFGFLGHKPGEFPEAEFVGRNGLHFGIHQYLTEEDIGHVSNTTHQFIGDGQ
jgi:dTDP-4-amino-4,6-dideoxygalactose transaminase